ncbi:hypothetical protein ANANG_G00119400 [Anguilla anguilla]|uniref:MGA conserved domain-containing protein n=1 Tax=Anguilla anguilla TaxID=7936 RepID=A0A9D3RX21_ANGAN|nr:hypothetical protein ANANG_G00119400 [Anguilla anguilla]
MLKLMDLEDRALWEGYRQTTVTNERAERALAALLTAQGTLKRSRGHAKPHPRWSPPCRRAFCRLGCVCASLAKGRRVVTHCRKPACMFGCSCLKHKMVLVRPSLTSPPEPELGDLIGQKAPGEAFPSNSELNTILEAETEVELEVELPVHLHRLWNRKAGEVDPEPLYVPTPVRFDAPLPSADFRVPKPAPFRTYVPRPNPVVRDEDKDPVYLYFESMMTCARVRGYMSKPPPERPLCYCKSVLCSGKEDDPYHYSVHLTAERRPPKDKARAPEPRQAPEEPRRTLEVLSECDWESERGPVLAAVCQRAAQGDLARPFRVGAFLVRPFGPALGREGRRPAPTRCSSAGEEGRAPSDRREAPRRDRAAKGFPFWSDVLPAGLLSAKKKQPGLPAKGLIEVNGKSYSQAKVQLGQMGALHMTSRLAAYLTGRWQPANQKRPVKAPPVSKLTGRGGHESPTSPPACPAGTATLGPAIAALGTSGPGFQPLASPVAPMLLVPVEDPDSDSAAPAGAGSPMPLVPGEGVVLHPVHGPSGGTPLFRHPSGRLVHLVPLDQLHPAPPDPPASSPDAVAHLPQASPPACKSASADTGAPSPSPTTPAPPPCPAETAPKPAPSFLGQRGTQTIRICPGVVVGGSLKGPTAPAGFTPLHVPRGPPRAPRGKPSPREGPALPESGTRRVLARNPAPRRDGQRGSRTFGLQRGTQVTRGHARA